MICVKGKNQKMIFLILLVLLLLSTTPSHAAARKSRFDRFSGSSSTSDEFKPSNFHGGSLEGNKEGNEAFGADKRKVYTGPNPLHNR
ncbi:hypothetical protein Fmac_029610 [Flemingia macrophylla]|uniref:Uncharacterized protein n=1 Tax=Flemingia macrophylla TaxID=520843 RepID=A0ABD1LB13_9FABA